MQGWLPNFSVPEEEHRIKKNWNDLGEWKKSAQKYGRWLHPVSMLLSVIVILLIHWQQE